LVGLREALISGDYSGGVSVVVPVYNAGPYLERCVASLLRQTLSTDRYEVVFVDDGSTDGSGARLDEVAAEHPKLVRVLHTANSGWAGRPRNLGTDAARHPYVFYCDADDWIPEYALEMLLEHAERDRSDVVVARRMGVRGTGPIAVFERGDYCTTWQRTPAVFHTLTCQKVFRRAFLHEQGIRFPEGKVRLEDYIFMVQAYLKSERISIVGSRPSYVLERREDRGNLTATKVAVDDYWRSVERLVELIVGLTDDGPERDLALDRVVRSELIGTGSGRAHLAKPEEVRIRAFGFAHRLLEDRVPPSAVRRLDSLNRRRAELISAGNRAGLERLSAWYAEVGAEATATDTSWRDGRLVVTLRAHLEHHGEPLELTRAAGRLTLSTPAGDGSYPLDVTTEVPRTSVHVVLRDPAVYEDRRVRASLQLDLAEGAMSGPLSWTATAEIDPLTAASGEPLRPAEWDLLVAVGSCGWSHVRPLVVPAQVPAPAPALLGSRSTVVVPFRRRRTGLCLDVGPSKHSLAAEVARRPVGAGCVEGGDVTALLPIVIDADAAVQVELRAEDGTPPRVEQGRLVGSPDGTSLRLPVDAVPVGPTWWSLHLALGGSAVPLGLAANRSPGPGVRVRQNKRPRPGLNLRGVTWRRLALRAAGRLGVHVTDIRAGAALVSRQPYEVHPLTPDEAYLVTRRGRDRRPRVLPLGSRVTLVATGKAADKMRAEKLGDSAWWVFAADGAGDLRVEPVTSRGWIASRPDPHPRAVTLFENDAMHVLGVRHLTWLLDHYRVDCVLDVGANVGQFAHDLRRGGFSGRIVSVEPVPAFVERLEKEAADDPQWAVHGLALGSTDGTIPLRVQRTFSSVLPASEYGKRRFPTLQQGAEEEHIVDVPLRRLETLLREQFGEPGGHPTRPRIFLKMDTQGFDLEVFRGLGAWAEHVVGLQSEVSLLPIYEQMPRMAEAIAEYEKGGFEISGLYPVTSEPDGRVIEYDCVMVRAAAAK
jgi:FkbM family methyltransferase